MTKKKERKSKFVHGGNIVWFQGRDEHISCRTDDGDRIAISGSFLFEMFDHFDFEIIEYGDYWKVNGLELKSYEPEDVLIDKGIKI